MAKKDPYAALRFKEFNIFLLVRFLLVFGWSMQFIIIEWQVYTITKDPLSLGIIGLMEVIPAVAMALFAGHIVDQREKRNLLAICTAAFSLISLGLFFLTLPNTVNHWDKSTILYCIYVLVFFGGFLRSFFGPTIFSLIALIVPKKIYPNAATWSSSTWQIASVLGPAFAGFSIHWIGVHWSLCIVFSLVLLSLLFVFGISKKPILNPKIGEPVMQSLKEGVQFVYKTKAVLVALTLDMISVLFGGAVALLPVFAQDILKVGPEGFGALRAAPAIGAFLTMLITAYVPISKKAGLKLLTAIFGFGLCIIVFGLSTVFWISLMALFFSGVTDGISMVIRQTILQLKTPDHMRGRVASVNSMFVGSSNELGAFESGLTAKLMGTATAVVFGGTMTLITVVTTGIISPSFRKLDLTKDIEEHEKE
ncbi:MFS transporter [Tenacibaculum maritimum]|uniref:MFS transporter n=1 Tax=Tenacibaculum maritimum TaxID=107401 RepID=UPI0012E423DB|nr:MFS transporter [Tenacibaculum maritimum]MCD9580758.1 MFS transporter [Tenacibaculum maritimum]MCD9635032.1 MFS transporter [Tenacibaculum maritimum]CAA0204903.1 Major facilitator superfamily (MFS) permease [Tenacibaculum maritimum]CAA0250134.1 Major facilitator superfamily (MFS) permease [Tenacibaculum maritimum]CAA0258499.1 Major facilitator superfamily (MFS) permease [Tenacibaculum maritimum]